MLLILHGFQLCQFSVAAITKYHTWQLKTTHVYSLWVLEFRNLQSGVRSRCSAGGSGEKLFLCLFQFLGPPVFLAPKPSLHFQSTSPLPLLPSSCGLSHFDSCILLIGLQRLLPPNLYVKLLNHICKVPFACHIR